MNEKDIIKNLIMIGKEKGNNLINEIETEIHNIEKSGVYRRSHSSGDISYRADNGIIAELLVYDSLISCRYYAIMKQEIKEAVT